MMNEAERFPSGDRGKHSRRSGKEEESNLERTELSEEQAKFMTLNCPCSLCKVLMSRMIGARMLMAYFTFYKPPLRTKKLLSSQDQASWIRAGYELDTNRIGTGKKRKEDEMHKSSSVNLCPLPRIQHHRQPQPCPGTKVTNPTLIASCSLLKTGISPCRLLRRFASIHIRF